MKKILICNCHETDCSLLCAELSKYTDAFSVKLAFSAKDIKTAFLGSASASAEPDVILCGSEFCGAKVNELSTLFPQIKDIPIIYIHGKDEISPSALSVISDVIFTPIDITELRLRIDMRSKRSEKSNVFTNGDLTIDYELCRVTARGSEVHLTLFEYRLLCILAGSCGKVITYKAILSELWDNPVGTEVAALRVYINAIRKKLGRSQNGESYIQTHMGIGYCMSDLDQTVNKGC